MRFFKTGRSCIRAYGIRIIGNLYDGESLLVFWIEMKTRRSLYTKLFLRSFKGTYYLFRLQFYLTLHCYKKKEI